MCWNILTKQRTRQKTQTKNTGRTGAIAWHRDDVENRKSYPYKWIQLFSIPALTCLHNAFALVDPSAREDKLIDLRASRAAMHELTAVDKNNQ